MRPVVETIAMVRGQRSNVLIYGESGTGKEVVARAIHGGGTPLETPFVAVNCGGIPEGLLESQLFGHRRGAFTGAVSDAPGLFQAAHGGTLFLDEIADMPIPLQTKLLRAVQDREVLPVGATAPVKIDVRLIAATNRPLDRALADGRLRQDLFYRLAVVPILLPPLRERPEDIAALTAHFSAVLAGRTGKGEKIFSPAAQACLTAYAWPGNVRELQNLVERLYVTVPETLIDAPRIMTQLGVPRISSVTTSGAIPTLDEVERRHIRQVLAIADGNKCEAARLLDIDRHRLQRKMSKYGLEAKHSEGETGL
jgi:transcriptional regulator with PAS, ATPase and Fis domain